MPRTPRRYRVGELGCAALIALAGCRGLGLARIEIRSTWPLETASVESAGPFRVPGGADGAVLYWEGGPDGVDAPIVRIRLNGCRLLALVDTGAMTTLMDASAARRCGVARLAVTDAVGTNAVAIGRGQGLGATFEAELGLVRELRLGGIVITNIPVWVTAVGENPAYWVGGRARRADIILGMDVIRVLRRMEWDGAAGAIRFGSAVRPVRYPAGEVAVTWAGGLPLVRIRLDGRELPALLDTGAEFAVYVPGPLSREAGLPPPEGRAVLAHGVGGRVVAQPGGEARLTVNGADWGKVRVWIGATGQGHAHLPFALLGRGAFGDRGFVLDVESGRIGLF